MIERYRSGVEINLIRDVVPLISLELNVPLRHPADMPLELSIATTRSTIFKFRKVALKESNLVLVCRRRGILGGGLDRKVVVHLALVDGGLGLGDKLCPQHALAVPLRGLVDRDFHALLGGAVGRVLEGAREVDIVADGA